MTTVQGDAEGWRVLTLGPFGRQSGQDLLMGWTWEMTEREDQDESKPSAHARGEEPLQSEVGGLQQDRLLRVLQEHDGLHLVVDREALTLSEQLVTASFLKYVLHSASRTPGLKSPPTSLATLSTSFAPSPLKHC